MTGWRAGPSPRGRALLEKVNRGRDGQEGGSHDTDTCRTQDEVEIRG